MATDEAADTLSSRSERDGLSCNTDISIKFGFPLFSIAPSMIVARSTTINASPSFTLRIRMQSSEIFLCALFRNVAQCCEPNADRGANRLVHFLFCLFASDAAYFSTRRNCAYLLSNCPKDYSRFIQNGRCLLR